VAEEKTGISPGLFVLEFHKKGSIVLLENSLVGSRIIVTNYLFKLQLGSASLRYVQVTITSARNWLQDPLAMRFATKQVHQSEDICDQSF
jgi:hypothetical protein